MGLRFFVGGFSQQWGYFAAGSIIAAIPVMVLFLFLQKYLVSGLTAGASKAEAASTKESRQMQEFLENGRHGGRRPACCSRGAALAAERRHLQGPDRRRQRPGQLHLPDRRRLQAGLVRHHRRSTSRTSGKKVDFAVTFNTALEDPWRMGGGFSVQMVFIFIDTDGKEGSGSHGRPSGPQRHLRRRQRVEQAGDPLAAGARRA